MHESDGSATGVYADRMLAAMQLAGQALTSHGPNDEATLRGLYQPGTELQQSASAFVHHLKSIGQSPEQVVVLVKQAVVRLDAFPRQFTMGALIERVISLCIDEYYKP